MKDKFGEIPSRESTILVSVFGKYLKDKESIGKIEKTKKGSVGDVFTCYNLNGEEVATMFITHGDSKTGNLRTFVDNIGHKFKFTEKSSDFGDKDKILNSNQGTMLQYLVDYGYM